MISDSLRRAWRFFHASAPYCTPPGIARCALDLARAEAEAKRRGYVFAWNHDSECVDVMECSAQTHEWCAVYATDEFGNVQGRPLASVGSVCDADDNFRRVIQAELAAEAIANEPDTHCPECGEEMDTDCMGQQRCTVCHPCPHCADGGVDW